MLSIARRRRLSSEGAQGFVITLEIVPELGGQEDLVRPAGLAQAISDRRFVVIGVQAVSMAR